MIYLQLAWVFFIVGVFGFGGGMAMISMIKMETVDNYGWLTSEEFSNVLAVSQVTPGPISINTATYVGYTQGGIIGCLTASLALCLPACILMFFIIKLLFKHQESPRVKTVMDILLPAVAGLILSAAVMLFKVEYTQNIVEALIFVICFAANYFYKENAIKLILISGLIGLAL